MIPALLSYHSDGLFLELLVWGAIAYAAFYVVMYAAAIIWLIAKALYEDFLDLISWIKKKYI